MAPQLNSILLPQSPVFLRNDFPLWKRRRLKRPVLPPPKRLLLRNALQPPSFDLFSLLSSNWLPTAVLGFTAGAAVALSLSSSPRRNPASSSSPDNAVAGGGGGEWMLFTSPTPFNRFVLLRCPSVSFEGGELLENVSEKLVREERHYVRLDSGRIAVMADEERGSEKVELEYQRVCVPVDDGGVISIDFPANLELSEERGLDTTVLIVPGTTQGSMEESVRSFVRECLTSGLFPIVMNPRGCANSPLTTARLFTAADSDDICSAIQFITRARPWSTLTGVGWGYGANMLTKYLAEAGEKTPLTAATCINNPFDLDEATRTSLYNATIDKKVTGGLIDILKSNKELFQGKRKGFDVEKALAAESIREFETAISMVSYGFGSLEDFYASCSTRSIIGNLKIPVLFIQNDDGTVPLFSVPRALIAENPFTSLLLCSCVPSKVTAISWYQQVTIEWLAAVELGLLKGRHPLLQDIDVTINPSKSLALMEGRSSDTDSRLQRLLNMSEVNEVNGSHPNLDPANKILTESAPAASSNIDIQYNPNSTKNQGSNDDVLTELNSIPPFSRSVDTDSAGDIGATPEESDSGQVLQTAQVVMNMLDVTMPGTFKEEEKRKVVQALGRGESLMKALQDAVPEDVRGKLTTSVSEILQAQGKNLNLDGLLSINQITNVSSGFKSPMKEKVSKLDASNESSGNPSDDKVSENDGSNKSSNNQSGVDVISGESPGIQPLEESPMSSDIPACNSVSSDSGDSDLGKGSIDSENSEDKHDGDASEQKVGQLPEFGDDGSEATVESIPSTQIPGITKSFDVDSVQIDNSQDGNAKEQDFKEINMPTQVENSENSSHEQVTSSVTDIKPDDTNQVPASTTSEGQLSEKVDDESDECISKDEKTLQPLPDQNRVSDAESPSFSVTQALDTLTGLDDSTQVAVNSVFGALEDVITQLEEKKIEKDKKGGTENHDAINGSVLERNHVTCELQPENLSDGKDQEDASLLDTELVSENDSDNGKTASNENNMEMNLVADKHTRISKIPLNLTTDPFTKGLYKEYLKNYIISKLHNVKSVNVDATDGLYLHYVPEEGHWILLENLRGIDGALTHNTKDRTDIPKLLANEDDIIEPSYVNLDKDGGRDTIEKLEPKENLDYKLMNHDSNLDNSISSIEAILFDALKVEVSRRLSVTDMKEIEADLAADIQKVAKAVCLVIKHDEEHNRRASISADVDDVLESSSVNGNHVVEAISKAARDTSYLKWVLPVGVVVGSSLAALRSCCDGTPLTYSDPSRMLDLVKDQNNLVEPKDQVLQKDDIQVPVEGKIYEPAVENPLKEEGRVTLDSPEEINGEKSHHQLLSKDNLMVGAVTAALGASAVLSTQQEGFMEGAGSEPYANLEETNMKKESRKLVETGDSKHQSNMVASLAEKAMSVAAPVVPTKEDGEVDHERIVNMLTEFGQRGGALRLVAKLALLWGGLRGAMSLTDRLISFLRVAERPLIHRILGFSCMVIVLWSPVFVPLLPTLLHNMATHNSSGISELACIVGLYAAVTILIMQWGKRIRGYEYPLQQYGLDPMSSRKVQDFLTGLVGGIVLVLSIQSVNAFLGFASFSLPTNLCSSSLNLTAKLKAYGQLILLASRGLLMAAGVTFVEELLFRAWLLEEVAADLGYHPAIILSGLAFSLSQRSVFAIPGLWLLSVCLAGSRLRKEGSLFTPIGLRTGIMSSSFVLQTGGFLICQPRSLLWVAGMHPLQPFTGVVGVLVALLLAVALYPRQPGLCGKVPRTIRT